MLPVSILSCNNSYLLFIINILVHDYIDTSHIYFFDYDINIIFSRITSFSCELEIFGWRYSLMSVSLNFLGKSCGTEHLIPGGGGYGFSLFIFYLIFSTPF